MCAPCKAKQQIKNIQTLNTVSSTIVPKVIKLPYDVCVRIFIYHAHIRRFSNLNLLFLVEFSTMGHTPSNQQIRNLLLLWRIR